ncbi:hypothetical protein GF324_07155 [bacterium]|nr:hypothetical protein [bacterium]
MRVQGRTGVSALSLLLGCCFLSTVVAQDPEPDTFDLIYALRDSLRTWEARPPVSVEGSSDTLEWTDLFPDAEIRDGAETGVFHVVLPPFMDVLPTTLIGRETEEGGVQWSSLVHVTGDGIVSGERVLSSVTDSLLAGHIERRLTRLRTLGLPKPLRPSTDTAAVDSIKVTLQGRDTERFRYANQSWKTVLRALAQGMTVYADVIKVEDVQPPDTGAPLDLEITYALLLTRDSARGHHFLRLTDTVHIEGDRIRILSSNVRFIPYIRTDNLEDLFAVPPDREETLGFPLKMR